MKLQKFKADLSVQPSADSQMQSDAAEPGGGHEDESLTVFPPL